MKNYTLIRTDFFLLVLALIFSAHSVSARINTEVKENKLIVANNKAINSKMLMLPDSMPHFKNIRPAKSVAFNKNTAGNKNLKPVSKLQKRDFSLIPSSVNGTMTARDPYLNDEAYVEFINGTVLPGEDKVNCTCGTGLTYVKLVLTATAGKDYMITTKVSPRNGNSFGLDLFADGFVHRSNIGSNEQEVKVILSPQSSGKIELWMQCSDPNGAKRPWIFHSLSVQEVN